MAWPRSRKPRGHINILKVESVGMLGICIPISGSNNVDRLS
jgi:hypothetical protein